MSSNQFHILRLQFGHIHLLINALDIASYCFKNMSNLLPDSTPAQIQTTISIHNSIKEHLKDSFSESLPLCPCSPEIPLTESSDDAVQVGKNEGNPFPPSPETLLFGKVKGDSFIKSYPKKQDITYLQALKDIKAQIEFLNKCAFDKSILTSDEHFALLGIEEELNQLIHFDPIRPADDGLPLRYDHFNCFSLPDNLE